MESFLWFIGAALFFIFVFGGETLISLYRERQQMQHIEKVIATLPEQERIAFAKTYLRDRVSQLKKTENPYQDMANEE
tara:strand:+ start:312 stop:545 length:234 start_codon:yes stop_codon:yes gene_type:complete